VALAAMSKLASKQECMQARKHASTQACMHACTHARKQARQHASTQATKTPENGSKPHLPTNMPAKSGGIY